MNGDSRQICSIEKFSIHLDMLTKLAIKSAQTHKHAACLMKAGKITTVGVNKYFQIKVNGKIINLGVHAEMDVCASTKSTKGMDILIIRVSKSMMLRNSRPCNACIDKLQQRGIRRAYYSNDEGQIVYEYVDAMPKLHVSSGCKFRERIQSLCL
jgi:deoxycytidylate deaminase